jgi:hypothetical protein
MIDMISLLTMNPADMNVLEERVVPTMTRGEAKLPETVVAQG